MARYRILEKMDTYATCVVEAPTIGEAIKLARDDAGDVYWSYETDYDSATLVSYLSLPTDEASGIELWFPAVVPEQNRYSFVPKENYA